LRVLFQIREGMALTVKLLFTALVTGALAQSALNIQVSKDTTHAIPSTLYGYMWEVSNIVLVHTVLPF
jgi:hypothetical protein